MTKAKQQICSVCGTLISELLYNGAFVDGCETCWKAQNYKGPPPLPGTKDASHAVLEDFVAKLKQRDGHYRDRAKVAEERQQKLLQRVAALKKKAPLRRAVESLVSYIKQKGYSELQLFNEMDEDGNGVLSRGEIVAELMKLGCNLTILELDAVARCLDVDGSGQIDFGEFYDFLKREMDELEGLEHVADERLCGFEVGDKVKIKIYFKPGQQRDEADSGLGMSEFERGSVMGPGVKPGTLFVKILRTGELFSVKASNLQRYDDRKVPPPNVEHEFFCLCDKCNSLD